MKNSYLTLSWLMLLYLNGTISFLRGFLLTRREIYTKSSPNDDTSCCLPPQFDKIIILVIDALRYDFLKQEINATTDQVSYYQNKMTFVGQVSNSSHSTLYQFIADPPTTTMQRLKGLTTGSLPTFIDVGNNFASDEVKEDNIISQIQSSGKNMTFMGDDTWMGLFPNSFQRSYPFPSFDVWDIHTVDRGVESHLFREISKKDWQVLIAHCLGVDHIGHRYGPDHPEMLLKLQQMDRLIETVIRKMDNSTLLLVMGDHGMTRSGDHGGDSLDEVNAGLFAFSTHLNINQMIQDRKMSQVDLVPTIALLLGIPIPFSNLGSVQLDLIPLVQDPSMDQDHFQLYSLSHNCVALNLNVKQVWRYLSTYEGSSFPASEFRQLAEEFQDISSQFSTLNRSECCASDVNCCTDGEQLKTFINKSQHFLSSSKEMCRSIWTEFDLKLIWIGLGIFSLALFVNGLLTCTTVYNNLKLTKTATICSFLSVFLQFVSNGIFDWIFVGLNVIPASIMIMILPRLGFNSAKNLLAGFSSVVIAALYTSNSFVVEEPYVVHYLVQSWIWIPALLNRSQDRWTILLSVSARLGLGFFRCREEQFPQCASHHLHRSLTSLSDPEWIIFGRILLALSSLSILYWVLSSVGKVSRITISLFLIACCHWLVEAGSILAIEIEPSTLNILPRFFYIVWCVQLVRLIFIRSRSVPVKTYWKKMFELLISASTLAILLAGDGLTPGIVLIPTSLVGMMHMFSRTKSMAVMWPLLGFMSLHGFFSGGHHTSIANIPWETAFVGFSHSNSPSAWSNLLPTLLVGYSTAFSMFFHALAVPVMVLSPVFLPNSRLIGMSDHQLGKGWIVYLLFHAIRLFGCMGAAAIHRRHLMVWKIFAPRLMYELLFASASCLGLIIPAFMYHVSV